MKVLVLGGYGVFGSRLVDLLQRDGHEVVIAGRSARKARDFADMMGVSAQILDRAADLSRLWDLAPDVVVDAAGPFHAYGTDPYRLARGCIENGVHYLDLADNAEFCTGICVLDQPAKDAGVFVLSGASSVPAVSSAIVTELAEGADEVDMISTAILPGNRAPRGRAVVASILNQCGQRFDALVGGKTVPIRSWSDPARFDLGRGIRRKAWVMEVPDTRLLGPTFGARTVIFRAGMELPVMNYALAALSWLRGKLRFGIPGWLINLLMWIAQRLLPLGSDVGGMSVAVTMRQNGRWLHKTWRLVATEGEGPFIPAVASRVILRDPDAISPGARPALAEMSREQLQVGLADLAVMTDEDTEEITPLFARFLGQEVAKLPQVVQHAHEVPALRRLSGRAKVTRGTSIWARSLAVLFRFPAATDDIEVSVLMMPVGEGEVWTRQFGSQTFQSHLRIAGGAMTERFGPFTFRLGLHVAEDALHFPVLSGKLGPIPLPRIMLPVSDAREFEAEGRFHFDVRLKAPMTGALMVHYQGWLTPLQSTIEAHSRARPQYRPA